MKENTMVYIGLGVVALYVFSKRNAVVPVHTVPGSYAVNPPVAQPSQSLLLPLLSTAASIFQNITQKNNAATNVANGYNADGTIALPDTGQSSVNNLQLPVGQLISMPVINNDNLMANTGTSNPTGSDENDFANYLDTYYG